MCLTLKLNTFITQLCITVINKKRPQLQKKQFYSQLLNDNSILNCSKNIYELCRHKECWQKENRGGMRRNIWLSIAQFAQK